VKSRALSRYVALITPWLVLHCGSSSDLVIGHFEQTSALPGGSGGNGGSVVPDADVDVPPVGGTAGTGGTLAAGAGGDAVAGGGGEGNVVNCVVGEVPPATSLLHRYDFSGTGTVVTDLVGGLDGEVMNGGMLDDSGILTLDEVDDYVDLPDGIVSAIAGDATFVIWTVWTSGAGYQRIFDFGTAVDTRGDEFFAMMAMPTVPPAGFIRLQIEPPEGGIDELDGPEQELMDVEHQLAVSLQSGVQMQLFIDGVSQGVLPTNATLSSLTDVNAWLGRSNWSQDPYYHGTYNEFRIYAAALTPCMIASLYEAGPDVLP